MTVTSVVYKGCIFFPLLLGLKSNIIGIIVYISANAQETLGNVTPKELLLWLVLLLRTFSFIIAEIVGVVAVHIYIEKHQQLRAKSPGS